MRSENQHQLIQLDTDIKMVDDPNEPLYEVIDEYQKSLMKEK